MLADLPLLSLSGRLMFGRAAKNSVGIEVEVVPLSGIFRFLISRLFFLAFNFLVARRGLRITIAFWKSHFV